MSQEYEKQYESDASINLKEFMWHLAENWKALVLCAVIVAILFTALMAYRISRNTVSDESGQKQEMTTKEIIATLPKDQRGLVSNAFQIKQKNDRLNDYIESAPMMEINPYNAHEIKTSWAIVGAQDDVSTFVQTYVEMLQSDKVCRELLKSSGLNGGVKQFREMMNFSYSQDAGPGFFVCTIALTGSMDEDALMKALPQQVEKLREEISKRVGDHSLRLVQVNIVDAYDSYLSARQANIYSSLYNGYAQLKRLQEEFTTEQKTAYKQLTADKEELNKKGDEEKPALITSRNIIIGLILGIILFIVLAVLKMLLSGRLHDAGQMQRAGIRSFGEWYDADSARAGLTGDRGLFRKHHAGHLDREFELQRMSDAVISACGFRNIKRLLIVLSAVPTQGQQGFVTVFKDKVADAGVDITMAEADEKEGLSVSDSQLTGADGAMLVLAERRTVGRHIDSFIEKSAYYDKTVIGSIYLG